MLQKQTVILSQQSHVCHQISAMMRQQGWNSTILPPCSSRYYILRFSPELLIVDIDDPACRALSLLAWFKTMHPQSICTALCRGGNSQAMRLARSIGIDGFFYLDSSGKNVDLQRGIAARLTEASSANPLAEKGRCHTEITWLSYWSHNSSRLFSKSSRGVDHVRGSGY